MIPPFSVRGKRLTFIQSDTDDSNFGVDDHGRPVLIDLRDVGVLPDTFVAFRLGSKNCTPYATR
jgi:hypothetical protein